MNIATALLLALAGCAPSGDQASSTHAGHDVHAAHAAADPHAGHAAHADHEPMQAAPPTLGASIYPLDVTLTDQAGQAVPLGVHEGHPVLISMLYSGCRSVCPAIVTQMQAIEASVPPAARDDLRFLLVTFDPDNDDTAALAALAERHGLDAERWRVMRAPASDVREIAAVLGIRYRELPDGSFNHASVVTLLDRSGEIDARVENFGDNAELVARITALAGS